MVTRGQKIALADLQALAVLANTKLAPAVDYDFTRLILGTPVGWLAELNRIRTDFFSRFDTSMDLFDGHLKYGYTLATAVLDGDAPAYLSEAISVVSGPWVVKVVSAGDSLTQDDIWAWKDVEFWFDQALTPTLASVAKFYGVLGNPFVPRVVNVRADSTSATHWRSSFRIGGTQAGGLTSPSPGSGVPANSIRVMCRPHGSGTGASGLSATTNIPGATFVSISDGLGYINLAGAVNVPPGLYYVEATITNPADWAFSPSSAAPVLLYGLTFTVSEPATREDDQPSIHSNGRMSKLIAPTTSSGSPGDWDFGLYAVVDWNATGVSVNCLDALDGSYFNLSSTASRKIETSLTSWTPSEAGLFVAKTIPVDRENCELDDLLSWTKTLGFNSTMRDAPAPAADTATIKAVMPAVNYRVGRYPLSKYAVGGAVASVVGMCIFAVTVRRASVDNGSGVYLPPTVKPAMDVDVGYYLGAAWQQLGTVTIASGAMDATIYPFWPVGSAGIALRGFVSGDADAEVMVHAFVNYQFPYMNGYRPNATYPIAACLYNDLEAVLENLPDAP